MSTGSTPAQYHDNVRTYDYITHSPTPPARSGNTMDQNGDGTGGQDHSGTTLGDDFIVPMPLNPSNFGLGFPTAPYSQDTVPIIIPGPYITSTYTNSGSRLQQNGTVSALYVTFDRFVDPWKHLQNFKMILRIMGRTSDITATAGPYTITPVDLNADGNGGASVFKISFANPMQYSGTYTVQIRPRESRPRPSAPPRPMAWTRT